MWKESHLRLILALGCFEAQWQLSRKTTQMCFGFWTRRKLYGAVERSDWDLS